MISVSAGVAVTSVSVKTSDEGGLSSEQITDLALDKILQVADTAPPAIQEQAKVFRENIRQVIFQYIELSRREEKATMAHKLSKNGNTDLADLVRRL